jgi:hypothetical protein
MLVMDEFGFERVEEALHRSVVIAIGPAAHRSPEAGGLHHLAILCRGYLTPELRVQGAIGDYTIAVWPARER